MADEIELLARIRELERQRNNALTELTILAGRLAVVEQELDDLKRVPRVRED